MNEEAKHRLDMARALERLKTNQDFSLVIESGYIEETAMRVGSTFTGTTDESLALMAVSHLNRWLDELIADGYAIRDEFNTDQKDK